MANQRDFNIIERAGKRGAEIVGISRPVDAGMVSAAFTRDESFVDPDIDPATGYPMETEYWLAGEPAGSRAVAPQ